MEIFSHINELRMDGWSALRTSILASEKMIIWAPSASYLLTLKDKIKNLPSLEELLWYIEHGHVQVMAREWWIENGVNRVNNKWEHARWIDNFDEQLLEWWREDQREGRTKNNSKVVVVEDENGLRWATGQINKGLVDIESIASASERALPGYVDRLGGISDPKKIAISLLRNARNHGEAFGWSGADRNLGSPEDQKLIHIIQDAAKKSSAPIKSVFTSPKDKDITDVILILTEVLDLIESLGTPTTSAEESFERAVSLLNDPDAIAKFRKWVIASERIATLVGPKYAKEEILAELKEEILKSIKGTKFQNYLFLSKPTEIVFYVFDVVMAGISIATGSPLAPISILPIVIKPIKGVLRKLGYMEKEYEESSWLYYIAEDSKSIKRKKLEKILRGISK